MSLFTDHAHIKTSIWIKQTQIAQQWILICGAPGAASLETYNKNPQNK